jgi:hypothetical protein
MDESVKERASRLADEWAALFREINEQRHKSDGSAALSSGADLFARASLLMFASVAGTLGECRVQTPYAPLRPRNRLKRRTEMVLHS